MTADAYIVIGVTIAAFVCFVGEMIAPDLVALLLMLTLVLSGVITPEEAFGGFGNTALLTVVAMFVLSAGLIRTGALDFISHGIMAVSRGHKRLEIGLLVVAVAVASAFMNNTPVAIMFLPVFLDLANRHGTVPSRLLIPMSFATILGGTTTLIGTSTNLLVSQVAVSLGHEPLGMFEFAGPGVLYALTGLVFLAVMGPRLLPRRASVSSGGHQQRREYVTEVRFPAGSPLVGQTFQSFLSGANGLTLIMRVRGDQVFLAPLIADPRTQFIREGDQLLMRGQPAAIQALLARPGIELPPELSAEVAVRRGREITLVELVVVPNSPLVGRTLTGYQFAKRHGGAAVIAVLRRGEHLRERVAELRLRMGDTLLVVADEAQIDDLRRSDEYVMLEGVESHRVERKAVLAGATLATVVLLAALDVQPIHVMAVAGSAFMVLSGCLPLKRAYDSIDLSVVVLIAGMLSLARAFDKTGLIEMSSEAVVEALRPWGPHAIFAGLFLLSTITTAVMSNNAVAVLLTPLAFGVGTELGLKPDPFIYAVLFGASCDFSTPIGYQTNLFVYGPGGYRFIDYARIGVPLTLALFLLCLFVVPLWFPFQPAGLG